ncbi:MAG: tail fiber domain-containing protein [Pseudomonadota bacterium]
MRRQVRQTLWALGLALALPFGAMAQSWDNIAMISATLGNTLGRVCIGAANADVGCPTYAPSLTSGGLLTATSIATGGLTVTGATSLTTISATIGAFNSLTVNGVPVTGGGGLADRITSGTLAVTANSTSGIVSLTTGGTTWGYFGSVASYLPTISVTTADVSTVLNLGARTFTNALGNGANRIASGTTNVTVNGTTNTISFTTAGSQRMVISANGSIGMGTNTPVGPLDVNGAVTIRDRLNIIQAGQMPVAGVPSWHIDSASDIFRIFRQPDVFTPGTSFFYVLSNGNVGINTLSPVAKLHVVGPGGGAQTTAIITAGNGGSWASDWPSGFAGGLATWDIVGASTYMTNYVTRSDRRYKKDIHPLDTKDVFSGLMKLKPVSYHYKDPSATQAMQYGLIAQDVREIWPNLVTGEETEKGRLGLNYPGFIAPLIMAVQTLKQENDTLRTQIQSLSLRLEKLERNGSRQP